MKPPFAMYGGKARLAPFIVSLMPKHLVYVEPFCGSAAVLFAKPYLKVGWYTEVINDLDGAIVNFFRVLQDRDKARELFRRLRYTPYSRAEYRRALEMLSSSEPLSDVEWAWAFYTTIRQSFSHSLVTRSWARTVARSGHRPWAKCKRQLRYYVRRLERVYIENLDAIECIRRWDSPHTLFYVDPPYPGAVQGYRLTYSQADFERLVEVLDSCVGSFILSCYENPAIPSHWERFYVETWCYASGKGQVGRRPEERGYIRRYGVDASLGNRRRVEVICRVVRNHAVSPDVQELYNKLPCFGSGVGGKQLTLLDAGGTRC